MIPVYVFDGGACVGVERRKARAVRFVRLAQLGLARIVIPLAVIPEWWRGRSDVRDDLLAASRLDASLAAAKAAGVALANMRGVDASMTIGAVVVATAALLDGGGRHQRSRRSHSPRSPLPRRPRARGLRTRRSIGGRLRRSIPPIAADELGEGALALLGGGAYPRCVQRLAGMLVGVAMIVGPSSAAAQVFVRVEPGSGLPAAETARVDELCRAALARQPDFVVEARDGDAAQARHAMEARRLVGRRVEWHAVAAPTASGFDVSLRVTVSPYESSGTTISFLIDTALLGRSLRDVVEALARLVVETALPGLRPR